jgi:hypothetical protein
VFHLQSYLQSTVLLLQCLLNNNNEGLVTIKLLPLSYFAFLHIKYYRLFHNLNSAVMHFKCLNSKVPSLLLLYYTCIQPLTTIYMQQTCLPNNNNIQAQHHMTNGQISRNFLHTICTIIYYNHIFSLSCILCVAYLDY